jgi:hypothetical protein
MNTEEPEEAEGDTTEADEENGKMPHMKGDPPGFRLDPEKSILDQMETFAMDHPELELGAWLERVRSLEAYPTLPKRRGKGPRG